MLLLEILFCVSKVRSIHLKREKRWKRPQCRSYGRGQTATFTGEQENLDRPLVRLLTDTDYGIVDQSGKTQSVPCLRVPTLKLCDLYMLNACTVQKQNIGYAY